MKTISADQVREMRKADPRTVVIDTLSRESYEKHHIPGALHVPGNQPSFANSVGEVVQTRHDPVIVYCADEQCNLSPTAAKALESAGYTNVFDFEGGLDEWRRAGLGLVGSEA